MSNKEFCRERSRKNSVRKIEADKHGASIEKRFRKKTDFVKNESIRMLFL